MQCYKAMKGKKQFLLGILVSEQNYQTYSGIRTQDL